MQYGAASKALEIVQHIGYIVHTQILQLWERHGNGWRLLYTVQLIIIIKGNVLEKQSEQALSVLFDDSVQHGYIGELAPADRMSQSLWNPRQSSHV